MANLILMRHAKSSWKTDAATDFERPLNGRGKRDAALMAQWIATEVPHPELIVSSPSERTSQTVFVVCASLEYPPERVRWENGVYEASLGTLLKLLRRLPDDTQSTMLVGHNPGMEELAIFLCGAEISVPEGVKPFPTAAVAQLRIDVPWSELDRGCGHLIHLVRPKELSGSGSAKS